MSDYLNLRLEVDEDRGIALITINRPDKLNALNHLLLNELDAALDEVTEHSRVWALVITGAGTKAFVAGADINEIATLESQEDGVEFSRFGQHVFSRIEALTIPVIMAVNGYALGGGLELAMCGDVRYASDTAQFGQPEVNLGVIPGYGGTQRLARLIGRDRAKLLIFTGERIPAEEAYRLGLVDRVLPATDLVDEALELAATLANKAPRAIALAKMAINEGISMPLTEALELEAQLFGQVVDTEDRTEGANAFKEKRQPHWTGR
ncbi:MAG TPA: enoyl-CoA hydratase-related protein [Chloroflexia bacterium]|jgi:enoyl-CoA hydratase